MDALGTFAKHSDLPRAPNAVLMGQGRCPHCHRNEKLFRAVRFVGCHACTVIRLAYPTSDGRKFTLAQADYAIVDSGEALFYTNLILPRVKRRPTLNKEQLTELLRDLIVNGWPKNYLFIHFGKPTPTHSFVYNRVGRPDFIHVSGEPTIFGANAATIAAWMIRDLLTRFPHVSGADWKAICRVPALLRDQQSGEEVYSQQEQYVRLYPGVFDQLPGPDTIEAKLLEVIADVASTRGTFTGKTPARRRSA